VAKFQIACPVHGRTEQIEVPDTNAETGFYEVPCGNAGDSKPVRVRLFVAGDIKSLIGVEDAKKPHAGPSYGQH